MSESRGEIGVVKEALMFIAVCGIGWNEIEDSG
jgi:hypothetical protein